MHTRSICQLLSLPLGRFSAKPVNACLHAGILWSAQPKGSYGHTKIKGSEAHTGSRWILRSLQYGVQLLQRNEDEAEREMKALFDAHACQSKVGKDERAK